MLVMLGMPPGTEFGIDTNTWNVGEKFKGVKMIPPGLHFIYFRLVSLKGKYHLFRQNTYLQNKKHTLTCQGGTGCYRFNYQPGS